jgi:hypothetical protein
VNSCQIPINRGDPFGRIEPKDSEKLFGPKVKPTRGVESPAPHVGKSLTFRVIELVSSQRLNSMLPLLGRLAQLRRETGDDDRGRQKHTYRLDIGMKFLAEAEQRCYEEITKTPGCEYRKNN